MKTVSKKAKGKETRSVSNPFAYYLERGQVLETMDCQLRKLKAQPNSSEFKEISDARKNLAAASKNFGKFEGILAEKTLDYYGKGGKLIDPGKFGNCMTVSLQSLDKAVQESTSEEDKVLYAKLGGTIVASYKLALDKINQPGIMYKDKFFYSNAGNFKTSFNPYRGLLDVGALENEIYEEKNKR